MKGRNEMMTKSVKRLAFLLAVVICISAISIAALARASDYIHSYTATTSVNSSNVVSVNFSVTGVGIQDKIGSTTIYLYEKNGNTATLVHTFASANNSNMMGANKLTHTSSVTYQGTANRSYYAIVHIQAGKDGKSDTRITTTNTA